MLISRREEEMERLEAGIRRGLAEAGRLGAAMAAQRLRALGAVDSGALLASIGWQAEGHSVCVGSDLPYSVYLHEGTTRSAPRPFLREAMENGGEEMMEAIGDEISNA